MLKNIKAPENYVFFTNTDFRIPQYCHVPTKIIKKWGKTLKFCIFFVRNGFPHKFYIRKHIWDDMA